MNYRHIYHAGNFADVFKHLVFRMVLRYVQQKDKGAFILDAFGGIGMYDLHSVPAQKTGEYKDGIARLMDAQLTNEDLRAYVEAVRADFAAGNYPGSPLLAARMLRPQDRFIANELHPDDVVLLRRALRGSEQSSVTHIDAYDAVRGAIPPVERRGIVLIDPPFEKKDEFQLLVREMEEWKKRWATGCYILWYPIKAGQPIDDLYKAAEDLGLNRTWAAEFMLRPKETSEGLSGCGLLIFNTPFRIPERVDALSPELTAHLGGSVRSFYLGSPE